MANRICLLFKEDFDLIPQYDIEYIESMDSFCKVFRRSTNKFHVVYMRINEIEPCLSKDVFCRTHKGFIVSLDHIDKISREKTRLCMRSGKWIPVGRIFQQKLLSRFIFLR
ncbi:MAG: LytTR family transcriptional regulator DNA-binding domain-containing protein [Chitinophagaceae bacterium]|nr:LytTR family transcriptional regulator DNA-binding domain-containing protein [Chitinophagaceae bacterium]